MPKRLLILVAFLGAIAVMLGAFGAHALKEKLNEHEMEIFNKGIQYHFVHVLAALFVILLNEKLRNKLIACAAYFFVTGIFFFSGSLYLLATKNILGMENTNWLIPITPLGGVFFIGGWLLLVGGIIKSKN